MTQILNARVKNLYKTESEWLIDNPIILTGELAIVQVGSSHKFKIGDGIKTFSLLDYAVFETGNLKGAITPAASAFSPTEPCSFIAEKGTYPNYGGVVVTGAAGFVVWDGTVWKAVNVNVDLAGYIKEDDIFEKKNLFDKLSIITGFYISATTGALIAEPTSAVSPIIPIKSNTFYNLSNQNSGYGGVVFYDNVGTALKPYKSDSTEYSTFQTVPEINGVIKSPPTAVSVQLQVKFLGTGSINSLQFSEGKELLPYYKFGEMILKPEFSPKLSEDKYFSVNHTEHTTQIRNFFDEIYDVVVTLDNSEYDNLIYSISQAKLILKSDVISATGIALNGFGSDDAAPSFFNGQATGGNHGRILQTLTSVSHGKTLADVGALYKDAVNKEFIIFKIIDANTIAVGARIPNTVGLWDFPYPSGNLSYVSNGLSTSEINVSAQSVIQLYPSINNLHQELILDNKINSEYGLFSAISVKLFESYDIIDTIDMANKLVSNRPPSGYVTQPLFNVGDKMVSIKNIYNIQEQCKIAIINSWTALKAVDLGTSGYFGITQNGFSVPAWATNVRRYFPNLLPITNNGNTYDFRIKPSFLATSITGVTYFTSEFWEDEKPVSRVVDMLESAGLNVNFNLGYLSLKTERSTFTEKGWLMTDSKKLYPIYFDGKSGVLNVLPVGFNKQGVAFRGWSKPLGIRSNHFSIENNGSLYIFIDYHQQGVDNYELPVQLNGKQVEVISKSDNITVSEMVVGGIDVVIGENTPMYGYCELLIR